MAQDEAANPQVAMLEPQGPSAKQIAKEVAKLVGVKSIQRGTIAITTTVAATTVTAVVVARAVLTLLGARGTGGASDLAVTLVLTNTTTITANRSTSTGTTIVSYELVEYN